MLNERDYSSLSDYFLDYLNTFKHEIIHFCWHLADLRIEFLKFRILEILNFHPCSLYMLMESQPKKAELERL